MTFEMNNSSRGAGRGRGGRGPGRGFSRGGFGDRGRGFRGGRGGDRGGRGSFRGGDRGTARRGSFGGPFQSATRGGRNDRINGAGEETPVCHEIAHGLQIRICYKSDIPSEEEITKQIPGFHSRFTKSNDTKAHFLLFKDIESLEAAKKKLDNDDSLDSVDYMGLKSARNQTAAKESRQLFFNFSSPQEEENVKKLDSKILSVEFLKDNTSCLAEFATSEEANSTLKTILDSKDRGDLKIARESHALKLNNFAQASIQPKLIVLRDVPKKTTLKDLAPLFPDATSVTIFNQTFPSSEYCHASLRFEDTERVKEILSSSKVHKILGKKIFIVPAYSCLLIEMPKLGEAWTGDQKTAVKSTETKDSKASPNKKIKLENNAASEEEDDDDDEEEEEEDDDEEEEESEKEEGKEGNDQNMGSGEDDDEDDAEEEESDDE